MAGLSGSVLRDGGTHNEKDSGFCRPLSDHVLRALNPIRKPSTAAEITELLDRDLELEDRPFQLKDIAEWLRETNDRVLTLYWLRARPRK
jgi:hypothetical protein